MGNQRGPELSIVVPTFNERDNIAEVVRRLHACMTGIDWEVIFVDDDSPDGTATMVRELAHSDGRVRVVHRIRRRGLSTACVEGMLSSSADFLAVMDADLQHDERILPSLLHAVRDIGYDIAVGSRYVDGGSLGEWSADRKTISRFATRLSRLIAIADLKDPMSGFFLLRRDVLSDSARNLSGIGFKILLDIFASVGRPIRCIELPYTFRTRHAGASKLDGLVAWEYLMLLLDKSAGRYVPVRFIPFALIGGVGVVVHMAVLWTVFRLLGQSFVTGQTVAAMVAMTTNFFMNNMFTYRDQRLHGWMIVRGLFSFVVACSVGAAANVGVATYLFEGGEPGQVGWVTSAIAGILVGAVWNYAVTAVYTWNRR